MSALQLLLISAMSLTVHPLIAALILFRSCQSAVSRVLVNTEIAPRVPAAQRATYLSLHSLSGRLMYSLTLLSLSSMYGDGTTEQAMLSMLRAAAVLAAVGLAALIATRGALDNRSNDEP